MIRLRRKEKDNEEIQEKTSELEDYEKEALETIEVVKKIDETFKKKAEKEWEEYSVDKYGELVEYSPPTGWSVVEEYWIQKPFCKVVIIYNEEEQEYRYVVVEPSLSPYETEVYGELSMLLRDKLEETLFDEDGVNKEVF